MKKSLLNCLKVLLILISCLYSMEPAPFYSSGERLTDIKLVSSSRDKHIIKFTLGAYSLAGVDTPKGPAYRVSIQKGTPITKQGAPDLAKVTQPIIIPNKAEMKIEVIASDFVEVENIYIAPSKGMVYRNVNLSSVPYTYGREYTTDAFYPAKRAELWEPYIVRDFRGQTVVVYPLQYNPVRKILRVCTSITVSISSTGNTGKINVLNGADLKKDISGAYYKMYARRFINFDTARYTPLSEKGSMLILCHTDFIKEMEPFVAWKKLKGIPTEIVDIAAIGSTSVEIKNYVKDYYNTIDEFVFLLLVGDYQQIPCSSTPYGHSDHDYGYIKGDDSYPEIITGRFSGEKAAHIATQVERSVAYEKNPDIDADWYHKAIGIACNEGENPSDAEWMRNNRSSLLTYTYTDVDELYDSSHGGEDAPGDPTAQMIQEALNEGRGLFNYMGHGLESLLVTGMFKHVHVYELTNTNTLPFAWLVACLTGNFWRITCIAEAGLRATHNGEPTGFIGVLAATISQPWVPPMHGAQGINDILIESDEKNIKRTFGGLCVNGIMYMLDVLGDAAVETADTWLIFGDPSLVVRTDTPEKMTVSHADGIRVDAKEFIVNCDTKDALISLTVKGEIIATAYTLQNETSLPITSQLDPQDQTMQVTVTAYNKIPYFANVDITPVAISDSTQDKSPVGFSLIAVPNLVDGVNNKVYFKFTGKGAIQAELFIYDVHGTKVYEKSYANLNNNSTSGEFTIGPWYCQNVSGKRLACGTYIALIRLKYQDGTAKIFKTTLGLKIIK